MRQGLPSKLIELVAQALSPSLASEMHNLRLRHDVPFANAIAVGTTRVAEQQQHPP
jgi:hypothetical protein